MHNVSRQNTHAQHRISIPCPMSPWVYSLTCGIVTVGEVTHSCLVLLPDIPAHRSGVDYIIHICPLRYSKHMRLHYTNREQCNWGMSTTSSTALVKESEYCDKSASENACMVYIKMIGPTMQESTKVGTHTCTYTHTPDSSLFFMSLPKSDIFGLPCTEVIISQALINASLVHVLNKHSWSVEFRCVWPSAFTIRSWTPSGIMPEWNRSKATVLASISVVNRSRNSFRISSAAWKKKSTAHVTETQFNPHACQHITVCYCTGEHMHYNFLPWMGPQLGAAVHAERRRASTQLETATCQCMQHILDMYGRKWRVGTVGRTGESPIMEQ